MVTAHFLSDKTEAQRSYIDLLRMRIELDHRSPESHYTKLFEGSSKTRLCLKLGLGAVTDRDRRFGVELYKEGSADPLHGVPVGSL